MREKDVQNNLILHASQIGLTLFCNNVGMYTDKRGNVIRYGLCNGSSDLISWTPVTVTPDMVGKKIAVFTAIEVKLNKNGKYKATDLQKAFISAVKSAGGFAGVADCNKDLEDIINA